jgi:hypothetical protein
VMTHSKLRNGRAVFLPQRLRSTPVIANNLCCSLWRGAVHDGASAGAAMGIFLTAVASQERAIARAGL